MWTLLGCTFLYFIVFQVQGDNCPYDGELTAASTPSITIFNQSLPEPYDRIFGSRRDGLECTWIIEASDSDKIVRLNFRTFHFMNTTVSGKGDCVAVYDGDRYDTDSEHLIQELCNRAPAAVYNSTDRHLTVVFRQGDLGGRRWMTMNYTMVTSPNDSPEESLLGGIVATLIMLVVVGLIIKAVFTFFKNCIGNGELCEAGRSLLDCCGRGLCSLCRRVDSVFHSSEDHSSARSAPVVRRTSVVLPSLPADDGDSSVWSETISLAMSSDGEGVHEDPTAAPPDYSSVTSSTGQLPEPEASASGTAPCMSVVPYYGDSALAHMIDIPPPSYDSLFKEDSSG